MKIYQVDCYISLEAPIECIIPISGRWMMNYSSWSKEPDPGKPPEVIKPKEQGIATMDVGDFGDWSVRYLSD